jgi:hypothetical protein
VVITQTVSVPSEFALSIGVTWGEGRGTSAHPIYFILKIVFFFPGYWFEVEIHGQYCPHHS